MTFSVLKRNHHAKGALISFDIMGNQVDILFTAHALSRLEKWRITLEKTAATLLEPEEVLIGHNNRFIAHRCFGEHVLRAVYEYEGSIPTLVTVYFPYKGRYFQGGGNFEDKIFPRK